MRTKNNKDHIKDKTRDTIKLDSRKNSSIPIEDNIIEPSKH